MSDNTQKRQLTEAELNSMKEIHISVDLKGFVKGWTKLFQDLPFNGYQSAARKLEGLSRKMMTGKASLLSMPAGIVLRNTARAAHNASKGDYLFSSKIFGFACGCAAVAAGVIFGGPVLAATLPAAVSGFIGTAGSAVTAGALSLLVASTPAYTAGALLFSSVVGAGAFLFSTLVSAPVNLLAAYKRTEYSIKGYEVTEEQLREQLTAFDRESPLAKYNRQRLEQTKLNLRSMEVDDRKKIYADLKSEFEKVAEPEAPKVLEAEAAGTSEIASAKQKRAR